eukprot:202330_1
MSVIKHQAKDPQNKERTLNGEVWRLWKQRKQHIRSEKIGSIKKIGRLKKEIKKIILDNGLWEESKWRSSWDTYTFVCMEELLFQLCVNQIVNASRGDNRAAEMQRKLVRTDNRRRATLIYL